MCLCLCEFVRVCECPRRTSSVPLSLLPFTETPNQTVLITLIGNVTESLIYLSYTSLDRSRSGGTTNGPNKNGLVRPDYRRDTLRHLSKFHRKKRERDLFSSNKTLGYAQSPITLMVFLLLLRLLH